MSEVCTFHVSYAHFGRCFMCFCSNSCPKYARFMYFMHTSDVVICCHPICCCRPIRSRPKKCPLSTLFWDETLFLRFKMPSHPRFVHFRGLFLDETRIHIHISEVCTKTRKHAYFGRAPCYTHYPQNSRCLLGAGIGGWVASSSFVQKK